MYLIYNKLAVEKDRDSIFTTIWKPGLKIFNIGLRMLHNLSRGTFFQCHVFAMKSVQNLKSFWRSSQNYFVLALFCSLHS